MARRWPTLREQLARQDDVLDETTIHVRPSAEERAALRAEAEAFLAERRAARAAAAAAAASRRFPARPRRPA
ncbi:MAG TPA: hypothetical protein VK066_15945 [Chloroflexota bacterium]|nr:hypothetical protein [Chloroflexota bacterium]